MSVQRRNLLFKGLIWAVAIAGIAFASKFAQRSASAAPRDDCTSWARAHNDPALEQMCVKKAPVVELLDHVSARCCDRVSSRP